MTVTVSDPWQRQVATTVIPALDRAEPVETQIVQLQIEVEEPGLHRVDVSVGGHGDVLWGMEISSGRYLVVGEVFVNDASIGGDIYFSAPDGAFTLSATTPHDAGIQQIWVYDALGEAIGAIDLVERGETVELEVPEGAGDRSGPWRLRLEAMNARVFSPALKYWTTESTMVFDPADVKRYIAPSAKNEQTFYTPERIATARENLERYGWAQDLRELIMEGQPYSYLVGRDYVSAADYAAQSDEFIWQLQPPTSIPRIFPHETIAECPVCGLEVRNLHAWQPYRLDPLNHPYQIQCLMCEDWFPSNDFGAGDMTSGDFPDGGDGWLAPDGRRFYFIRTYANAAYSAVTIPALQSLTHAYLLTDEPQYARKAAILLARLASVYPNHDDRQDWLWAAPYGGRHPHYTWKGGGMITDLIWETFCTEAAVYAYDAVYDYLDEDPGLIAFLQ